MGDDVWPLQRRSVREDMVKRFYDNEDEDEQFQFDDDNFDDYNGIAEEGEAIAYVTSENLVDMMHMDLAQTELNQHLLSKAIDIAQRSLFWRLRSTASKMKEIRKIYKDLLDMTEEKEGEQSASL